jgi:hypothetical protein
MQTKGAKKAVRICEPEVDTSMDNAMKIDNNNNSNNSLKSEVPTESIANESTSAISEDSGKVEVTLEETYGLRMIEEDESDFVRIESTTDSGYTSSKPSAKLCEFEPSESYL